jgi:serine/threonine protein kinase
MDPVRAKNMEDELVGRNVGGWQIAKKCGNGKSAIVFRATKDGQTAAVKVFDREMVERAGEANQLERIKRELSLLGKTHPHLINILGGGKCDTTKALFVVMEYLDWPNLESVLRDVPRNRVRDLISQLSDAARFLESLNLAHRDIKPANILVSPDFQTIKLLDLGVLKPIGEGGLTDVSTTPFIGTHQYSPPEFIKRYEENDMDGWRAISFYQIGAVLYDLLTRRPIFSDAAKLISTLVMAVVHETPVIDAPDADPDLVSLATICLSKDAGLRVKIIKWESFSANVAPPTVVSQRERLKHLQQSKAATPLPSSDDVGKATKLLLADTCEKIQRAIRQESIHHPDVLPPARIHDVNIEASPATFRVVYGRSAALSLAVTTTVFLRVTVLDVASQVVEIAIGAFAFPDAERELAHTADAVIFTGVFFDELYKPAIQAALYSVIEKAVLANPHAGECCRLIL